MDKTVPGTKHEQQVRMPTTGSLLYVGYEVALKWWTLEMNDNGESGGELRGFQ